MPVKILPYITKTSSKQEDEKPKFVSRIQKPKKKKSNTDNRLFFLKET